jgi:NADH-quinone oxidoreductase subunit G
MSDIEIEIDGKKILTQPNKMVIQVADDEGIYIPRFCYHKHLSIAANCRMCLVEVEKAPKPMPACATPVMAGMKVFTRSAKALAAQRAVMEFLLINHPLDCPICDQGGECELQDLSMGYGRAESYYTEGKRAVTDPELGPLIATEMTRCIHCTRCVRFGDEVAGMRELGLVDRGEHTEITTYIKHTMHSEISGNVIDLCPVGALTSKPFRFTARAWELQQYPTIAPHDCLGSHIHAHTRRGTVMRIVPRENNNINQTWISDRDRFSYQGLYHADRLSVPLVRRNGKLEETDWQTALEAAMQSLQTALNQFGSDQLAALASPSSTVEEFYLLQKLCRSLGSANVDHRLRQVDFSDQQHMPAFPSLNMSLTDLENSDVILLIGSNIQKEQPMASLRVRKAVLKGAQVIAMNMFDYSFSFKLAAKKIVAPQYFLNELATLDSNIAAILKAGKKIAIVLGASALNHPQAASIRALAQNIATTYSATVGMLTEGANAAGAWLAGMVPHRGPAGQATSVVGSSAKEMFATPHKAYLLLNVEPNLDCEDPVAAKDALNQASSVVALSLYQNSVLNEYADVILPMAAFTETSGTFINAMGEWQGFTGVASAWNEARPAWKILRVLGNLLQCEGFDYETSEQVRKELRALVDNFTPAQNTTYAFDQRSLQTGVGLMRIGEIPIYAGDSLTRHAEALQAIQPQLESLLNSAGMHPETAKKLNIVNQETIIIKTDGAQIQLPVMLDERVPPQAVWIAAGIAETAALPGLFAPLEIEKQ